MKEEGENEAEEVVFADAWCDAGHSGSGGRDGSVQGNQADEENVPGVLLCRLLLQGRPKTTRLPW